MEFDWLAADEAGQLAQMLSSGVGRVPEAVLSSEEDVFALHLYLDELPFSEPLSISEGSFQALLAQPQRRGLYVYDAQPGELDASGRTAVYTLLASPRQALTLTSLPEHLRGTVARVEGHFAEQQEVTVKGI